MHRLITILLLLCILPSARAQETPRARLYTDGPLTATDFQGEPDKSKAFWAWTATDIRYTYQYRYRTENNATIATLSEIKVWAELDRAKSWNTRPKNALLMDHEQGHFDIAHIHAWNAQLTLHKDMRAGKGPKAQAGDQKAAVAALEEKVRAMMKDYLEASNEANRQYDIGTASGNDAAKQAEARRAQQLRLRELVAEQEKFAP
jgi:hypothetical protein